MKLIKQLKTNENTEALSGIILRKSHFNSKERDVNDKLKSICETESIPIISHYKLDTSACTYWSTLFQNKGATEEVIKRNTHSFLSLVTKSDSSFPNQQFEIKA